jgi:hypothetical protein
MNSLSMESIFLALSGVILVAGVLYWFWSHIQLTQKKVQLLENAVFELRGMLQRGPGVEPDIENRQTPEQELEVAPGPLPISPEVSDTEAPAASSMYNDLSDDDWKEESTSAPVNPSSTPLEYLEEVAADLQPGGRIEGVEEIPGSDSDVHETVQAPVQEQIPGNENEQFRELFMSPPVPSAPLAAPPLSDISSLDGMPVKDLRRLAEQRGIPNASELRKKEILSALKALIAPPSTATATGPSVQVEKTLDLTEVSEILE